jgi:hypothetical protein
MPVVKLEDVDFTKKLSVKKSKDACLLQLGLDKPLIQTPWIRLSKYCLPSKKFVKDTDECISLTIPVEEGDVLHTFFHSIDTYLASKQLVPNRFLHKLVAERDDNHYVKFKLYLHTAVKLGCVNTEMERIHDIYGSLQEGSEVRLIFSFTKLWQLNGSYGFSNRVEKLHVRETWGPSVEHTCDFID